MNDSNSASDLRLALRASKRGFIAVGFFSLFVNLLMLTPPIYMLQIYDRVVASRSMDTLLFLTALVVFLFAVMGTLQFVRSRILVRVGNQIDGYLSERVYSAMFTMGIKDATHRTAQPLSDFTTVRQFLTGNGVFAFFDAPWLPVYIAILFMFHPSFGWFAIAAAVILFVIAVINERSTRKLLMEANGENVRAQELANSNVRNAEVLHAMGMLPQIMGRWHKQHQEFLAKQSIASDRAGVFTNISKTLRLLFQSLILGLGAYYVVLNEMSAGVMIAGSILLGRALAPLDLLIGSWQGFTSARSAYKRLDELLEAVPARQRRMSLPAPRGSVGLENLFIVPPGAKLPAIRGANFTVEPGEHIGIIGPSAAGKSSLARAVVGVWPAANGAVRIDDANIAHYNADELGPHIGYLPQDIELFDGSVGENIARFDPDRRAEDIVAAAKKAGVHEMILQLPNGYDTVIGSNAGALSGGQRQRVGLARALYGDPRVVVLDEPNSNLDEKGEEALANTLTQLKQEGVTLFVVSHRKALLRAVDKLLVLKEGTVHMYGPRDEVMMKLTQQQSQGKLSSGA